MSASVWRLQPSYRVDLVAVSLQHFARLEIEHGPPLRRPLPAIPVENCRAGAEVADRLYIFHASAFNGLKADCHTDQPHKLAVSAVSSQNHAGLKAAFFPRKPARLPSGGCCRDEFMLEPLPVLRKLFLRPADTPRKHRRPRECPHEPRRDKQHERQKPNDVAEQFRGGAKHGDLATELDFGELSRAAPRALACDQCNMHALP
jgi:hypothetical protein